MYTLPKGIIVTIILTIVLIIIGVILTLMLKGRSRVPRIISQLSALMILVIWALAFYQEISDTLVMYVAIGITAISVIIECIYVFYLNRRGLITVKENTKPYSEEEIDHFKKLIDLILSLEPATNEDRLKILADIEKERIHFYKTSFGDEIRISMNAINQCIESGVTLNPTIESCLRNIRDYMDKNYQKS